MKTWYNLIEKCAWLRHVYNFIFFLLNKMKDDYKPEEKVFVIGLNKTGTTSTEQALSDLGYILGKQADGELLSEYVLRGKYTFFYEYLKTGNAFQDLPFGARGIYKILHKRYPNAKFILTVRQSADAWFDSLESFSRKFLVESGIELSGDIKVKDYKQFVYRYPKMSFELSKLLWLRDRPLLLDDDIFFDREYCKFYYNKHIEEVVEYFTDSDNLLILDVSSEDAYQSLCSFLSKEQLYDKFPHLNITESDHR